MSRYVVLCLLTMAVAVPARGEEACRTPSCRAERAAHVKAIDRMMAGLREDSAGHSRLIRSEYGGAIERLAIPDREGLRSALGDGRIVPLAAVARHPVEPRLDGRSPIGELDLPNQPLYVAARPETLGCLLAVASRVRSGPLDVTSLVRHDDYQRQLARGNVNARTSVPTHVMGLAFDISVLHTPLATAAEIRDVLTQMAGAGDLYFVAERRQLVFHVVPAPERREYFAGLYRALRDAPPPVIPVPDWRIDPDRAALTAELDHLLAGGSLQAGPFGTGFGPLRNGGYATLFAWMATAGVGAPPGEDLLLMGAGALTTVGVLAWWPVMLLAIAGVALSDTAIFCLGRVTARSTTAPARRLSKMGAALDAAAHRWGAGAIAVARFIPGTRALVFFSAGARRVPAATFVLVDVLAAALWVPVVMTLGAWLTGSEWGRPLLFIADVWR